MASHTTTETIQWSTLRRSSLLLLLALSISILGYFATFLLSAELVAWLAGINLFVIFGLFLAQLLKWLQVLQWPLLIMASFLAGLVTAIVQQNSYLVVLGLVLLGLNFALLSLISRFTDGKFQRFNLLIGLLALIFSFVGAMLIFVEALPFFTLLWTSASFLCLDILLYTLLRKTLQTEPKEYFAVASPMVLLQIGLLANAVMGMNTWFSL